MTQTYVSKKKSLSIDKKDRFDVLYEIYRRLYRSCLTNNPPSVSGSVYFDIDSDKKQVLHAKKCGNDQSTGRPLSKEEFSDLFKGAKKINIYAKAVVKKRPKKSDRSSDNKTFPNETKYTDNLMASFSEVSIIMKDRLNGLKLVKNWEGLKSYLERYRRFIYITVYGGKEFLVNSGVIEDVVKENVGKTIPSGSLTDKLISAGIKEEAIFQNEDLFYTLQSIEENKFKSKNKTYFVEDENNKEKMLKILELPDHRKDVFNAEIFNSANHYLSPEFDFMNPELILKPKEESNIYLSLQKDLRHKLGLPISIDSLINGFARFHSNAENVLEEHSITLPDVTFRSAKEEMERYNFLRQIFNLPLLKESLLAEDIAYLKESPHKGIINNDLKREHIIGNLVENQDDDEGIQVVDWELMGKGSVELEIPMIFTAGNIPLSIWDVNLDKYCRKSSFDFDFSKLEKGLLRGARVAFWRELNASLLRLPEGEDLSDSHLQLLKYITQL